MAKKKPQKKSGLDQTMAREGPMTASTQVVPSGQDLSPATKIHRFWPSGRLLGVIKVKGSTAAGFGPLDYSSRGF